MALLQPAPESVIELMSQVITEYHPELGENKVRIDVMMALPDLDKEGNEVDKPAVVHNGYPALAKVRITSARERARHEIGDAEITIDDKQFRELSAEKRLALIDHELYHLQIKYKDDEIQHDKYMRPRLKMRKHDHEYGWFNEIANRHGAGSVEWEQVQRLAGSNSGKWILDAIQQPLVFDDEDDDEPRLQVVR